MTTGMVPDGAGLACSLTKARTRRRAGEVFDVVAVEQLEAHGRPDALPAGLHTRVPTGHDGDPELRPHLVVGGQDALGVGHQDLPAAVTVEGFHLPHRTS